MVVFGADSGAQIGLLPDSPWYFLKSWKESVGLFFTFGKTEKAQKMLHLADLRLQEREALLDQGKEGEAQQVREKAAHRVRQAISIIDSLQMKGESPQESIMNEADDIIATLEPPYMDEVGIASNTLPEKDVTPPLNNTSLDRYFIQPLALKPMSISGTGKKHGSSSVRLSVFGAPATQVAWSIEGDALPQGLELALQDRLVVCTRSIPPHCASTRDALIEGSPQEKGEFVFTVKAEFSISEKEFVLYRTYTLVVVD